MVIWITGISGAGKSTIAMALVDKYKEVLRERTLSDFPIACLLSGGIDSSSIASIVSEFKQKNKL